MVPEQKVSGCEVRGGGDGRTCSRGYEKTTSTPLLSGEFRLGGTEYSQKPSLSLRSDTALKSVRRSLVGS